MHCLAKSGRVGYLAEPLLICPKPCACILVGLLPNWHAVAELLASVLGDCSVVQVCYYRDKQSINKFQMASVKAADGGSRVTTSVKAADGGSRVTISEPFALDTKWDYKVGGFNCYDLGH